MVSEAVAAGPTQDTITGLCPPLRSRLRVEFLLAARQNAPAPSPTGPYGVLAYARMLHPLGPAPANWTVNPLR